ncbi:antibiotic biosynthesis monooxygenase family protein [Sinomonas atrocyanea]
MNLISDQAPGVYVLIVLTVRPENQQAVIDILRAAGDAAAVPGLRSRAVLRSLDGTQVINHMHWDSKEAYDYAHDHHPAIRATRSRVQELIETASANAFTPAVR